ncbi:MAG TPA: AI-2E family transporter [Ohtaekwangia sp.]|uniref:AI-2E family transporter n=1 Tax=Ohtaekwangia sp. TaxID=2066019 RepID=UPI002F93AC70
MTIENDLHPFYKRLSLNLISISILGGLLYIGQDILLPLFFSMLLAALLLPVVNFLERRKLPRGLCIAVSLFVSIVLIFGILYFLTSQVMNFLDDFDMIKKKITELILTAKQWVSRNFHVGIRKQNEYLQDTAKEITTSGPQLVGKTFVSLTAMGSYVIFIPIYTFLLLYYKDLIRKFLIELFREDTNEKHIVAVLHECQAVAQYYITGLLIEMTVVFALNTLGFIILGIKYAVFLALISALLNLIPYVGMLVANLFCMLITLITSSDPVNVIWVAIILAVVQLIDNNFLMPFIVGSKVKINALATILGVLIGGAICGVPGMFLAIPGVAVLKVISDHVEGLKPWGTMMGDKNGKRGSKEDNSEAE